MAAKVKPEAIAVDTEDRSQVASGAFGRWFSGMRAGWTIGTYAKLAVVVLLLIWPIFYVLGSDSNYALNVMTQAGLYAIITLSVGLVLGQAGQLSFGHSAFYGIGAYACGLWVLHSNVPTLVAWIAGGVAAGIVAIIVGRPVLKLKYFYLALATMGLGQIFLAVIQEWKWGGATNGFGPVRALNIFGFEFNDQLKRYYMVWVVCLVILLFLSRLLKYRVGRALRALSVSEIASSTLGVRNANWKLMAFVFNAVFCGLAGGLFAFVYTAVDPHTFSFAASVLPIVMMLIGGDRVIWGGILGAVILTWVFNAFSGSMLQYNGTMYSVVMILLLLFLPAGILGLRPKMARRLWAKIKGESLEETSVAATVACADAVEAEKDVARCDTQMALPTPESMAAAAPATAVASAHARNGAGEVVPPPEVQSRWGWTWLIPLALVVVAFFVMNWLPFLPAGGTEAKVIRATTRAYAKAVGGGLFALSLGLPMVIAMALYLIRWRWTTVVSAVIALATGIYSVFVMLDPVGLVGIDGELKVGSGLIVGTILLFAAFALSVVPFLVQTGEQRRLATAMAGAVSGDDLLSSELAAQRSGHAAGPLLRIENVSVHFGGLKAVSEVSFEVEDGSITALIGPNGAGKTTLFNAVSRLQTTAGGRIFFGDKDLSKLDAASTARLGMARTFQNLRIFVNMSVIDNVLVGCHRHESSGFFSGGLGFPAQRREEQRSRARAMDALRLVGLDHVAELPASSLPYGQQRLVEIARALASEPRLLLLDEPAAGTNQSERDDLVKRIATIRKAGITVLIVEHDIDLVMDISDQVNVLDYGKLIASGTPDTVQKDQKVITAYLGVDQGREGLCASRDLVDGDNCPVPEELLVVENLVTSYGSIEALHGVSLKVPKGFVVTVLGANGAGKSTLLHTISGIVKPSSGKHPLPRRRYHAHGAREDRGPQSLPGARGPAAVPEPFGRGQPHRGRHRSQGQERPGRRYRLHL